MAGTFGFARETSDLFALACDRAAESGAGLGAALGDLVIEHGGPGLDSSLLVAARRAGIPLTVHVAIGTDIVHMTPELDGASLGKASLDDFRSLANLVARMAGGVWLNLGSAVVLPEVFLKAVAMARNLGRSLDGLTTANLDFNQQYRGLLNVLQRPGAEGIALTGHHELMIPLLHAAVVDRLAARAGPMNDHPRLLPEPGGRHRDGHAGLPRPANGFPGARMVAVVKPNVAPTLDGAPWFDDRIGFDPRSESTRGADRRPSLRRLRAERADLAVLFPNSFRSALMAWRPGRGGGSAMPEVGGAGS